MWLLLPPHGRRPVRGDPERKKPLECEVPVYRNSENAIAAKARTRRGWDTRSFIPPWVGEAGGRLAACVKMLWQKLTRDRILTLPRGLKIIGHSGKIALY
jgi:hypothetical protein